MEEVLLKLAVATFLGIVVGYEREVKNRPAGLTTFTLVSLGSCGFALLVLSLMDNLIIKDYGVKIDPARIIEGVITGIGFLGAGTIMQSKTHVTGITTGATIWVTGAIGLCCGFGLFKLAITLTIFVLLILVIIGIINRFFIANN